jgi:hypothetical protein
VHVAILPAREKGPESVMDIHVISCSHVLLFASPSFAVTTLVFRVTTLSIPYHSDGCADQGPDGCRR